MLTIKACLAVELNGSEHHIPCVEAALPTKTNKQRQKKNTQKDSGREREISICVEIHIFFIATRDLNLLGCDRQHRINIVQSKTHEDTLR